MLIVSKNKPKQWYLSDQRTSIIGYVDKLHSYTEVDTVGMVTLYITDERTQGKHCSSTYL